MGNQDSHVQTHFSKFQHRSNSLKNTWVIQEGDSLTNIRVGAQGAGIWWNFLWRQTLVGAFFCCFASGLTGKASACNAGDLGSIPGSGRSLGEGNSYPLHILAWRIPWTVKSRGHKESDKTERLSLYFTST